MNLARRFMELALKDAHRGIRAGDGGPFGACIVKNGTVISVGHNRVLASDDPTAHAEVCAIRAGARKIGGWDFSGCEIYSTTEPCVMCFAAVNWARIDKIYFGTTVGDVAKLGFNELTISNKTLKRIGKSRIRVVSGVMRDECRRLLESWKRIPGKQTY